MKKLLPLFLLTLLTACVTPAPAQSLVGTIVRGNASLTNALTASSTPCKLYSVTGYNSAASVQFVQVFQTVAGATNGATPVFSFPVGATNYYSMDFSYYGADLDACKVCISSTASTLTLTSANTAIQAIIRGK